MKLFGRKKNDEILNIKNDLINIEQNIKEVEKSCEKQVEKLNNNFHNTNNDYEKKIHVLEEKYKKLDEKLDKIQKIIKLLTELDKDSVEKVNQKKNNSKKTIKSKSKTSKKKHLYSFKKGEYPLYKKVSLNGKKIIGARGEFQFNIEDVINIKNNLNDYHNKGIKASEIGRKYNIARGTIQKVIYNIEEGIFDGIIKEYQNKENHSETNSHKIHIAEGYRVSYNQTLGDDGSLYLSTGKKMPYTIQDIIKLRDIIQENDTYSIRDILNHFNYSYDTGCRLIWNIEEGNYNDLIKKWTNKEFNHNKTQKNNEKQKHFRNVCKSLCKPLSDNLTVLDGGEILNKNWGRKLSYTVQDVLELQQRIPDFNNYPTFEDLSTGLNMSITTLKTTVWRIEEGYFEDIIHEYLSRNYHYENNFNRLFIDGKNTGLSIDKCISIVECIINTNNKKEVVNKLIKMYPTVDSKYIRIISEEYNNPNLSKVLKKEVKKVEKIDNPQKRKEQGVFL